MFYTLFTNYVPYIYMIKVQRTCMWHILGSKIQKTVFEGLIKFGCVQIWEISEKFQVKLAENV